MYSENKGVPPDRWSVFFSRIVKGWKIMSVNVAEVFGQDVFNEAVMKERLPEITYKQMLMRAEMLRWSLQTS